jgi:hypothetical protein
MKKWPLATTALVAGVLSPQAAYATDTWCQSATVGCGTTATTVTGSISGAVLHVTNTDASGSGSAINGTVTNTGSSGVAGFNNSTGGKGVYGESDGATGYGVYGTSTHDIGVYGTSSDNIGVEGNGSSSTNGLGVYGYAGFGSGTGVKGEAAGSTGTGVYGLANGSSASAIYGTSTNGYAGYFNGLTEVNGNLVVEDNTSIYGSLTVTGALTASGGCTGCSDLRMKKNVKPLTGALDQLLELREVTFEWIDPTKHHHERETGTQVGFIAQDLEKIHPQWVNPEGYKSKEGETFRTIDLHEIEALEVGGIRELKMRNDALEAKTGKQQAEIDELKEAVARLRNGTDPISGTPGFGHGVLALFALGVTGASSLAVKLALKRMGMSLATALGLLLAGRKKEDKKLP